MGNLGEFGEKGKGKQRARTHPRKPLNKLMAQNKISVIQT